MVTTNAIKLPISANHRVKFGDLSLPSASTTTPANIGTQIDTLKIWLKIKLEILDNKI